MLDFLDKIFAILQYLGMTGGAVYLGLGMGGLAAFLVLLGNQIWAKVSRMVAGIRQFLVSFIQQFFEQYHY